MANAQTGNVKHRQEKSAEIIQGGFQIIKKISRNIGKIIKMLKK